MPERQIELRGVDVHNLKSIDLDIPHRRLVVICGVSGSGKTSLALDTLYAEGQRRYIESFSAYTRQFLERLEKPDAERIDGLPPAMAVTHQNPSRSNRATVATATELADYFRLLFARAGNVLCHGCGKEVRRDTPTNVAAQLAALPEGTRVLIGFGKTVANREDLEQLETSWQEEGIVRVIWGNKTWNLAEAKPSQSAPPEHATPPEFVGELVAVLDRLAIKPELDNRLRESVEMALARGDGQCIALVDTNPAGENGAGANGTVNVDDHRWQRRKFSSAFACGECGIAFTPPEPRLYSFNSPLGACPTCEGFGNVIDIDLELVVPDRAKSIRDGAIAPWNSPGYAHELEQFIARAPELGIDVDLPFSKLGEEQWRLIREGDEARGFAGLRGFFLGLERHKYKMHLRVFLSRWRSYRECPGCHGARLRPESLRTFIGGRTIADVLRLKVVEALAFFRGLHEGALNQRAEGKSLLEQIVARLSYLDMVGLGYLTLDRTLRTLSGGEAQRVALTSALGSNLVNMLYVLDEPTVGLHSNDVARLLQSIERLRDRGNTVVIVEHEERIMRAADQLIEIGPAAGDRGGEVVFQGRLAEMVASESSLTGDYLSGRRGIAVPEKRRQPLQGWIRLTNARGNNLKNLTVEFPLGVLCAITGVSGSGKSTLVHDTLYGALCKRKRKDAEKPLPFDDVFGDGQIDDVVLVDQDPISRSPRSNPVTYIKAFDEIRRVFAELTEARTHNYTAGHFSFNVEGGRCDHCDGDGHIQIDMQFLADVYMKCPQCGGNRYRDEILQVQYRGRNIAEVLNLTVREAFSFFRGQTKVQTKLKRLMDVGLDYLKLGQPANTLSAGEAQRLKLAAYLTEASRNRTLFLLDEPTTGLHFHDVVQLLDCFEALLSVGHSLIVVEHNVQLIRAADYVIDLGPGAAEAGGTIVCQGTPEKIIRDPNSATGKILLESMRTVRESA